MVQGKWAKAKLFSAWDFLLMAVLVLATLLISITSTSQETGDQVRVYSMDELVSYHNLDDAGTYHVEGKRGKTVYVIENHEVHIMTSPCKNHTCTRMGSISRGGQSIICIPNQVLLRIDAPGDDALDGVTG